jgi:methylated-DNA-[protein]-cysteine S-methyltransferase
MINEYCSAVQSPIGEISIFADEAAVSMVSFLRPANASLHENKISSDAANELTAYFEGTVQQLHSLSSNREPRFSDLYGRH